MSNPKGGTLLRPGSFAMGVRDGWRLREHRCSHRPRCSDSVDYAVGYEVGAADRARIGEWLERAHLNGPSRPASAASKITIGRPSGRTA